MHSRKGASKTGTREVTEVAVRLWVPGFNGNDFWEELAKYSMLWGETQISPVFSISVGCPHPLEEELPISGLRRTSMHRERRGPGSGIRAL